MATTNHWHSRHSRRGTWLKTPRPPPPPQRPLEIARTNGPVAVVEVGPAQGLASTSAAATTTTRRSRLAKSIRRQYQQQRKGRSRRRRRRRQEWQWRQHTQRQHRHRPGEREDSSTRFRDRRQECRTRLHRRQPRQHQSLRRVPRPFPLLPTAPLSCHPLDNPHVYRRLRRPPPPAPRATPLPPATVSSRRLACGCQGACTSPSWCAALKETFSPSC
mmetsp:Transcript_71023/g.133774  ORF Transcript_71023/g.133774 Transcript_71023/m.133774 type:complete len:217 (+) Transcript_71023:117-767(+)